MVYRKKKGITKTKASIIPRKSRLGKPLKVRIHKLNRRLFGRYFDE